MVLYSKESLDELRSRIDLADVVSSYVKLQKSGASYKGLCPFHEEKTPSFTIRKGDSHYHCFGCGAHGDAVAFLMDHLKMSFSEGIEYLAERFQVPLEEAKGEEKGPNKGRLKSALERACLWYRFFLLHSEEGHEALRYLYERGIDLRFIRTFEIGYAPKQGSMIYRLLRREGFSEEELLAAGLIGKKGKDFFSERITFPVKDRTGAVIGFSARKFREETFGGKYVNTSETVLFKKSHILYGFCYGRYRIAKDRIALIVEGQIDALRLIDSGFDFTVAGLGTAFGEAHVKELLMLGVTKVYLALDPDKAGREATVKIGDLFQNKGVEAIVVSLPDGLDPDAFLRSYGKEAFQKLLDDGTDYLTFYYRYLAKDKDLSSPSCKNEILETMVKKIKQREQPVMVYESLKKLASLASVPEEILRGESVPVGKKETLLVLDPDRILETDLLRYLLLAEQDSDWVFSLVSLNLSETSFIKEDCRKLFSAYKSLEKESRRDSLALAGLLQGKEEQGLLGIIRERKINPRKIKEGAVETVKRILFRSWTQEKEEIVRKIGEVSQEEALEWSKRFAEISKRPPSVILPKEEIL